MPAPSGETPVGQEPGTVPDGHYSAYREQVRDSFQQWYGSGRDSWSGGPIKSRVTEFILSTAPPAEPGRRRRVLDIGCGRGHQTAELAEGLDADTVGLDLLDVWAPPPVTRGSLRFRQGDFLGFHEGPMDMLVDSGCLHHQRRQDWERWVRHGGALLREGGVWTVNIFLSPDGDVVDKRLPDGRSNWWLTEELVTELFTGCGFDPVARQEVDRNFQYEGHWLRYLTLAFSRMAAGS
ncbi:class I SAM-dependent methyltransferase [Streptomyces sp. TP-A0874]|uniref:class I SAM-dependent methyltransferase n=1 Tax=Streptomyces sp. TP-A0874 TaxID=549819 RepID=UPI00099FFB91|nr:class I SAM-dependent methyltransferase [Streptomyces sp. TP-A0874]